MNTAVWDGFIALFGLAVDDGVLMATYIHQLLRRRRIETVQDIRDTVYEAGLKRIRPCVMTTVTTVLARRVVVFMASVGRVRVRFWLRVETGWKWGGGKLLSSTAGRPAAVVGDRPETDLATGIKEGWPTILVLTGVTDSEKDVPEALRPTAVVRSFADVPSKLGRD